MSIDPLEAIIKWLTTALTGPEGRVANKHRFGSTWPANATAVCVNLDDGVVELYAPVNVPRLEVRIYADARSKIQDVYNELVDLSRTSKRFAVGTSNGIALVHYFQLASGLSFVPENDLKMELGIVFFESMVAEEPVP